VTVDRDLHKVTLIRQPASQDHGLNDSAVPQREVTPPTTVIRRYGDGSREARVRPVITVERQGWDRLPGHGRQSSVQSSLVALEQEGDRLRRFRTLLPCEVVVTAVTHPLSGCRLRAYAVRHVDGVAHLKVELPDGLPGLVAAAATDVFGAEAAGAEAGLVLDGVGLRRLRAVVMRLHDGDASGPGR